MLAEFVPEKPIPRQERQPARDPSRQQERGQK
jgi:hypothetical protein